MEETSTETETRWTKQVRKELVGRTIKDIRYLTEEETPQWNARPIVLILDDGQYIIPMMDDEGNDGGSMATSYENLPTIPTL